jgi:putative oxidoreductase
MEKIAPRFVSFARVGLGLVFVTFSLNYFVPFLPAPDAAMPAAATALLTGLVATKLFPFIKSVELVAGLLLLSNRWVPLALTWLAPIVVGITAFHAAFPMPGLSLALFVLALELVLAWSYREAFALVLRARVVPGSASLRARAHTHGVTQPAH